MRLLGLNERLTSGNQSSPSSDFAGAGRVSSAILTKRILVGEALIATLPCKAPDLGVPASGLEAGRNGASVSLLLLAPGRVHHGACEVVSFSFRGEFDPLRRLDLGPGRPA